jgi:hypothetical protein
MTSGDTPLAVALLAEHNEVVLLLNQKYDVCIESIILLLKERYKVNGNQGSGMLAGNIKAVEKASKSKSKEYESTAKIKNEEK